VGVVLAVVLATIVSNLLLTSSSPASAESGGVPPNPYIMPQVVDTNPDPDIVETVIVADEITIPHIGDGRGVINAMAYNGKIPGPEFRLKVGDTVRVHFFNQLDDEYTGIHWHGIELANRSDGTQLVQNQVDPGESYIYEFTVTRPGIYWYHPHHHYSTNQLVKGLYGSLIVEDPNEDALVANGTLPPPENTLTLLVGDMTICKEPGSNDNVTYPNPGNTLPHVSGGTLPVQGAPRPIDLCQDRKSVV